MRKLFYYSTWVLAVAVNLYSFVRGIQTERSLFILGMLSMSLVYEIVKDIGGVDK